MKQEFIQVVLEKKVEGLRKRRSATHEFQEWIDGDFKRISSCKISIEEFYNEYYSRKDKAYFYDENMFRITITFEN